ncbi:J domain-containing protein [Flavobacterium arcticum]|uniref:J domain-containing protein n=1 Tax=Flavobacterium arcticum TaxID=1784713 RepID=A0A345HCQ7_9FLAO|nr:J domain-containing protein [Flavobacterium arcticum]AXG74367.1 J domain-containing protein [Flavobacterium arcticum]KAF2507518.1 J domain-containing protein [Flavobacterium arcticum]
MSFIDYYKVLGVDKKATAEQIKNAYRKKARKLHPDLNPDDKDANKKFQQLNEANEVLSDPEKKAKYDKYGKDWERGEEYEKYQQSQQQQQRQYSSGGGTQFEGEDFSSFFESMFGGQGRRSGGNVQFKGQDFNAGLNLTLKEAYTTHKQTFTVNGKNIRITIPAGVEDGQVIKLAGQGSPGRNGGPNGDLYITFSVANTDTFKRVGNDLYTTKNIDLYTAVLGDEITITTIDNGTIKLKVAPETQNNTKVRLKGKGFPLYKKEGKFGDLYITYNVLIPTNLTDKQKELFTELKELSK